mmetsp:Transcript_3128/g.4921  ORF Transcript_3128/g.4921 Transcript_3128/m.4921 type:complete len:96 (-) Transcript_3128:430-717(-)
MLVMMLTALDCRPQLFAYCTLWHLSFSCPGSAEKLFVCVPTTQQNAIVQTTHPIDKGMERVMRCGGHTRWNSGSADTQHSERRRVKWKMAQASQL